MFKLWWTDNFVPPLRVNLGFQQSAACQYQISNVTMHYFPQKTTG